MLFFLVHEKAYENAQPCIRPTAAPTLKRRVRPHRNIENWPRQPPVPRGLVAHEFNCGTRKYRACGLAFVAIAGGSTSANAALSTRLPTSVRVHVVPDACSAKSSDAGMVRATSRTRTSLNGTRPSTPYNMSDEFNRSSRLRRLNSCCTARCVSSCDASPACSKRCASSCSSNGSSRAASRAFGASSSETAAPGAHENASRWNAAASCAEGRVP